MISDVTRIFDAFIHEKFSGENPEAFRYLINHSHKPRCIERVCDELQMIERRTWSIAWDADRYRGVIREMAKLFCLQALEYAEQQAMTYAEKQRRISEQGRIDDIQAEFDAFEDEALNQKETSFLNEATRKKH